MIRGPLRNAGLISRPMKCEIFYRVSGAENFHLVQMQKFLAGKLDTDKAGLVPEQIYLQWALVGKAEEGFAVVAINRAPGLPIIRQTQPKVRRARRRRFRVA